MSRAGAERGSAEALGIVMMTPLMVGIALVVVLIGRDVDLRAEVGSVSAAAATAAAQQRSASGAVEVATAVADGLLTRSSTCRGHRVDVDTLRFAPGGRVSVTVECTMVAAGLDGLVDGDRRVSVTSTAAVDRYRAMP